MTTIILVKMKVVSELRRLYADALKAVLTSPRKAPVHPRKLLSEANRQNHPRSLSAKHLLPFASDVMGNSAGQGH